MSTDPSSTGSPQVISEDVTATSFGADLEPGESRPEEKSHWIGDDPIGFTWLDDATWSCCQPGGVGADITGFASEHDALSQLVAAHLARH